MTNWKVILNIAKTHLLTKFKQTAIATLGVTFGIGAYISLIGFMTGFNTLMDDLILNRTPHVHIYNEIKPTEKQPVSLYDKFANSFNVIHSVKPKQSQKKIHNALAIMQYLEEKEDVRGVLPQTKAQIFYLAGAIELGGNLTGINAMEEARLFNLENYITEGSVSALKNNVNSILIGKGVAQKMSLKVGDRVQISTVQGDIFPLKIVGFYQSGLADIDNIQSFTNLETVQRILGKSEDYITDIHIKLYDMEKAPPLAQKLEQQFKLTAIDIKSANAQFDAGNQIRNIITYAVSITLLTVAGFGIYNILNMFIYEKMNDIAILKAIGFSGKDVQLIFMSQAIIIGFVGGLLGLLIGYALSAFIDTIPFETEALPTMKTYPINYNFMFYIIGISFAMISTFFAGFFPSRKAKKIDPVRIIQGQ